MIDQDDERSTIRVGRVFGRRQLLSRSSGFPTKVKKWPADTSFQRQSSARTPN